MSLFDHKARMVGFLPLTNMFQKASLRMKMFLLLAPALILLLLATGYFTYRISYHFITVALERNVRVQGLVMANAIEQRLEEARQDLLFLAASRPWEEGREEIMARIAQITQRSYPAFGYVSQYGSGHAMSVWYGNEFVSIPAERLHQVEPNPMLLLDEIRGLAPGDVWISPLRQCEYPVPLPDIPNLTLTEQGLILATPVGQGDEQGIALLMLDARDLRNIVSLYNSEKSPIWAYARTPEIRYAFLFDLDGWILFQSDDPDDSEALLSSYLPRSDYEGTLGRPGLECAFRPAAANGAFWKMVSDVRQGLQDLIVLGKGPMAEEAFKQHSLSYSPVTFRTSAAGQAEVLWGLAFVDRSRLTLAAGYKFIDVMLLITLASVFITLLIVFIQSRIATNPILRLTRVVRDMLDSGRLEPLSLPNGGYETTLLREALNSMIDTVRRQVLEIKDRDRRIRFVGMRERADMEAISSSMAMQAGTGLIPEIVGMGPRIEQLKSEILKAAHVDVDVLVMGETGTGKQLTAEAVHGQSGRADKPFISINCGALDENLLMDTLFGHVKGAFTEARSDRKGAFVEAHGGSLFLDEIQLATPKVQQALLRTLAMRKVKPLGSDREVDVDVRVIAATNVDLRTLIEARLFREDLYFRLKVITIQTPALRDVPENIPVLALHFLQDAQPISGRSELAFTKGALEKLNRYAWPGNVRELKNCITRAAVMSETGLILAEEISLDGEDTQPRAISQNPDPSMHDQMDNGNDGLAEPMPEPLGGHPGKDDPVARDAVPDRQGGRGSVLDESEADPGMEVRSPGRVSAPVSAKPDRNGKKDAAAELSQRQQEALPLILQRGSVSRSEYQEMHEGLASRTAIYDLQDLVRRGILEKRGRGPSTRYVVTQDHKA